MRMFVGGTKSLQQSPDVSYMDNYVPYVDDTEGATEKRMRLRYAGTCRVCGIELPAKVEAIYERSSKTVRCLAHEAPGPQAPATPDAGTPGSSARREFDRRKAARERRIRTKHRSSAASSLLSATSRSPPSLGTPAPAERNDSATA